MRVWYKTEIKKTYPYGDLNSIPLHSMLTLLWYFSTCKLVLLLRFYSSANGDCTVVLNVDLKMESFVEVSENPCFTLFTWEFLNDKRFKRKCVQNNKNTINGVHFTKYVLFCITLRDI